MGRCRDSAAVFGFTTTYNDAGTAKRRASRTRIHEVWVGLWVGKLWSVPALRGAAIYLPERKLSKCGGNFHYLSSVPFQDGGGL